MKRQWQQNLKLQSESEKCRLEASPCSTVTEIIHLMKQVAVASWNSKKTLFHIVYNLTV